MQRSAPIVLFVIYGCPYCKEAKRLCSQMKLPHKAYNVGSRPQLASQLARDTGSPTVPKIFVQGKFIGGYDQLVNLAENGQLIPMLNQPMV